MSDSMRKIFGIGLGCAWLAIFAAAPYIYIERKSLELTSIIVILLIVLLVGNATVITILFLLDKR